MASTRPGIQCKYCDKTFNKGEHLRRHERSHTGARPFACSDCGKAFSRQDSLLRHQRLHGNRGEQLRNPLSPPLSNLDASPGTPVEPNGHAPWPLERLGESADVRLRNSTAPATFDDYTTSSADLNFELIWPDTQNLFRTIASANATNSDGSAMVTPLLTDLIGRQGDNPASFTSMPDRTSVKSIPLDRDHHALHGTSRMATGTLSSMNATAEASSITSVFLDECLHLFFVKFVPVFPVLHRPTFVFRECIPPLLLNAIAIGSLYLGPKDAIAKGEALWRLAHTAVTGSWELLIAHRGPNDFCKGLQLVTTALLSQAYGALSRNRVIRTASQTFRSLGFSWARHCGMYDCEPFSSSDLPLHDAPEVEIDRKWRKWSAIEVQQRSLLGHYIVDGLVAQMSGKPASIRHSANKLYLLGNEAVFEASSGQKWLALMRSQQPVQITFRSLFSSMFSSSMTASQTVDYTYSAFSTRVVLEGLQSLVLDCAEGQDEDSRAIGVPTKMEVRTALAQVHDNLSNSRSLHPADRLELLLRWHSICLDTYVDISRLCTILCTRHGIKQHLWPEGIRAQPDFDLTAWVSTADARRALLHAVTIQEIVEELPRGRAHVIHMPICLFAASTIYIAFALAENTAVSLPRKINWRETLFSDIDPSLILTEPSSQSQDSDTRRFIHGQPLLSTTLVSRSLVYELNSMQKLFRCLFSQWGIAYDMEAVIDHWISLCH